jgi:hypothetical protein
LDRCFIADALSYQILPVQDGTAVLELVVCMAIFLAAVEEAALPVVPVIEIPLAIGTAVLELVCVAISLAAVEEAALVPVVEVLELVCVAISLAAVEEAALGEEFGGVAPPAVAVNLS